jgi:starch synthase
MKVLFATAEAAPYIKTGGLGDVMHALPLEVSKNKNASICVFLPYYKKIKENKDFDIEFITSFYTTLGWRKAHIGLFRAKSKSRKLKYYFIDNEYYFGRDNLYGYFDDGERFAYFSKAVLEALAHIDFIPDVVHLNDWQTALVPVLLKLGMMAELKNIKTVFTIHNIEYQGKMPGEFAYEVLGFSGEQSSILMHDKCINLMKGAITCADKITAVSKTYSHEIKHAYYSHGLDEVLRENEHKLLGITNGIDTKLYNPETDKNLPVNYSAADIEKKKENKRYLQEMLKLEVNDNIPVIAMISRLVSHKGMELVAFIAHELLKQDIQLAVLGTGDKRYEDLFRFLECSYPNKVSANIKFDLKLASRIYAGADMFLMPSKSEPCGLAQLIAMRYGTVPVVRETGGLFDTVPALDTETMEGRGFTFKVYNAHDMLGAVNRCIDFYHDKEKWQKHIKNIMGYDSSWKSPALEYVSLYKGLITPHSK